ncbi:hypothetical protein [Cellulomonas hominis]|uniref:hypothetical protein n=1 Tax=Cellulomonas hominis TaxID=156981 RepID=UPI001B98599B|nr:hypothetical protein [Cellulomonas hominis]VTR78229.1 hypothetical protein CHMI_03005 [Cellulomonas hominis]
MSSQVWIVVAGLVAVIVVVGLGDLVQRAREYRSEARSSRPAETLAGSSREPLAARR